jgi:hypothetical protein
LVVIAILGITVLLTALTSDVNSVLEPGIRLTNGQPDLPAVADAWRGGELQGLTEEERREIYDRLAYDSGRAVFEIGSWFFDASGGSRVDEAKVTCPVLVVAGSQDRITPAWAVRQVARKYGGRIDTRFAVGFEGFHLDHHLPAVQRFIQVCRSMGIDHVPLTYYGGSDANVMNRRDLQAVNLGTGVENPHSKEERISVHNLVKAAEMVMRLVGAE